MYELWGSAFFGSDGNDRVLWQEGGDFFGGPGHDTLEQVCAGEQHQVEDILEVVPCPEIG